MGIALLHMPKQKRIWASLSCTHYLWPMKMGEVRNVLVMKMMSASSQLLINPSIILRAVCDCCRVTSAS